MQWQGWSAAWVEAATPLRQTAFTFLACNHNCSLQIVCPVIARRSIRKRMKDATSRCWDGLCWLQQTTSNNIYNESDCQISLVIFLSPIALRINSPAEAYSVSYEWQRGGGWRRAQSLTTFLSLRDALGEAGRIGISNAIRTAAPGAQLAGASLACAALREPLTLSSFNLATHHVVSLKYASHGDGGAKHAFRKRFHVLECQARSSELVSGLPTSSLSHCWPLPSPFPHAGHTPSPRSFPSGAHLSVWLLSAPSSAECRSRELWSTKPSGIIAFLVLHSTALLTQRKTAVTFLQTLSHC